MSRKRGPLPSAGNAQIKLINPTTAAFYDKRGNPIQVRSNNQVYYTGATAFTDTKTIVPDFTGVPKISKVVKQTGASTTVTVYTALTYDHMYRVTPPSQPPSLDCNFY